MRQRANAKPKPSGSCNPSWLHSISTGQSRKSIGAILKVISAGHRKRWRVAASGAERSRSARGKSIGVSGFFPLTGQHFTTFSGWFGAIRILRERATFSVVLDLFIAMKHGARWARIAMMARGGFAFHRRHRGRVAFHRLLQCGERIFLAFAAVVRGRLWQ